MDADIELRAGAQTPNADFSFEGECPVCYKVVAQFVAGIELQSPAQERQISASPFAAPLAAPLATPVSPEEKLRAWVEANYTRIPLREKDSGAKLEALYTAYATCLPPVHAKLLGKIKFGRMLNDVYAHIGPHRTTTGAAEVYLLR